MKEIRVPYIDQKGEKGNMRLLCSDSFPQAAISAILALSYIGADEFNQTVTTALTTPQAVVSGAEINNDRDFKILCSFKGASGYFKISWPAPKINIEGGFVVRFGEQRSFVPLTKQAGETGNDGADLAALVQAMTGDATVTFSSGRLYKKA